MKNIRIGNWQIEEKGISWVGSKGLPAPFFIISVDDLTSTGFGDRKNMYDWLLYFANNNWSSKEDIYALNTALIYTMELNNIPFPKNMSFVDTIVLQEELVSLK